MTTRCSNRAWPPEADRVMAPQPTWPKEKSFHLVTLLSEAHNRMTGMKELVHLRTQRPRKASHTELR